jgi:hypothetical protein
VTGTLTVNGIGPHAFSGALTINPSSGDIQQNFQRSGTGKGILSVPGTAGNIVADSAVDDFVVRTTSGKAFRVTTDGGNTSSLSVATATVSVLATTASTTTSTGALVVGGGLGVGGAVNIGGTGINVTNSGGLLNFNGTGNTTAIKEVRMVNSGGGDWMAIGMTGSAYAGVLTGLGNDEPFIYAPATFRIFRGAGLTNRFDFAADQLKINATTASTSTSSGALVVSGGVGQYASPDTHKWQCNGVERASLSSAGALTVGSSLTTGAPSGGTAAAWKLGTVATVSPTSPNRTIEVDIGGTIYYIHAKTTNN